MIPPRLVPTKAGDRVKTDRRDAEKLARCYRAGGLTAVWVPDAAHEALRDLVRAREAAKKDQLKARHRLGKFLLRHGQRRPEGIRARTKKHREWTKGHVRFEQPALEATLADYLEEVDHAGARITKLDQAIDEALRQAPREIRAVVEELQALRGVAQTVAVSIVAQVGSLSRFPSPRELMGYSGLVPSEYSSGNRVQRGGITKTGNGHLRRVIGEAAWAYQHRPNVIGPLAQRQKRLAMQREKQDDLPGRRSTGCTNAMKRNRHAAKRRIRSSLRSGGNCSGSFGLSGWAPKSDTNSRLQHKRDSMFYWTAAADDSAGTTKRRILPSFYAVRPPAPTRASSPRQLPTDHDHAVPTREYQIDHRRVCSWAVVGPAVQNKTRSKPTIGNVFPLRRPSTGPGVTERCSQSRVRFAAQKGGAPLTTARRSGRNVIATGGSGGNTRPHCTLQNAKGRRPALPELQRPG